MLLHMLKFLIDRLLDLSDVTHAVMSPSPTRREHNDIRATSSRQRSTNHHHQQQQQQQQLPSSENRSGQRQLSQTRADTTSAMDPAASPVRADDVEPVRSTLSTSAASETTSVHGAAPPSSSQAAPSHRQRRRLSRQHSVERQVPVATATPQRSSATQNVASSDAALPATSRDNVAPARRRSRDATAALGPATGSANRQTPSEHHATPRPQSHRSAAQLHPLHSSSSHNLATRNTRTLPSAASEPAAETTTFPAPAKHQNTVDEAVSCKPAADGSGDVDGHSASVVRPPRRRRQQPKTAAPSDGVRERNRRPSSSDEVDQSASRRLTMPSVVHYNTRSAPPPPSRQLPSSLAPPDRPVSAVYVLPDGVRRRLVPSGTEQAAPSTRCPDVQPSTELAELAEPPQRYRLEPARVSQPGGSMVNVSGRRGQREPVWRREDVSALSEQRRQEIRQQKEHDQQQTFVLRFGNFKVNE